MIHKQIDKFFDVVIEKTVKDNNNDIRVQSKVIDTNETVIHIVIPYDFAGKKNIAVYRYHVNEDGQKDIIEFRQLDSMPEERDYTDGTVYFEIVDGYIHIYATKFSMYAIAYEEDVPSEEPDTNDASASSRVYHTVTFDVDGDTSLVKSIKVNNTLSYRKLTIPEKDGYTFDGWYTNAEMTKKLTYDIIVMKDITLYGRFVEAGTVILPSETENHFAYIVGYEDGTVRPNNSITREEVATIFYRLLDDATRESIVSENNSFTDVAVDRWSNKMISTMTNGGYVTGYEDGTFGPDKYITRAELATMAVRFKEATAVTEKEFSDFAGHWAESFVRQAANAGWITGYEDGTFAPDAYITRAEAMAIINRMLGRNIDAESLSKDVVVWSDINENDWYYYIVLEATNSHAYKTDGQNEKWSSVIENKAWS